MNSHEQSIKYSRHAEIIRRILGYHDTSDIYKYYVFSDELACCDLGIDISIKILYL